MPSTAAIGDAYERFQAAGRNEQSQQSPPASSSPVRTYSLHDTASSLSLGRMAFEAYETRQALATLTPSDLQPDPTSQSRLALPASTENIPNAVQTTSFLHDTMRAFRLREDYETEEVRIENIPRFFDLLVREETYDYCLSAKRIADI